MQVVEIFLKEKEENGSVPSLKKRGGGVCDDVRLGSTEGGSKCPQRVTYFMDGP